MESRQARFSQAKDCQGRLQTRLVSLGCVTTIVGQEAWLSSTFQERIRHTHNDLTIALIRYFPDLFCLHPDIGAFLVQSKSTTPKYYNKDNFSIETAALRIDHALTNIGARVIVIFENRHYEFYYTLANTLPNIVHFSTTKTGQYEGSRTPMSLIAKNKLPALSDKFIGHIKDITGE